MAARVLHERFNRQLTVAELEYGNHLEYAVFERGRRTDMFLWIQKITVEGHFAPRGVRVFFKRFGKKGEAPSVISEKVVRDGQQTIADLFPKSLALPDVRLLRRRSKWPTLPIRAQNVIIKN